MKKVIRTLILMVIIVGCANLILDAKKAEAIVTSSIPLQVVDDIDNYPYPASTKVSNDYDKKNISEFTLDSQGQVKVILHCDLNSKISGSIWVSTDFNGYDIVESIYNFTGNKTDISWFLDSGTYYLNSTWNDYNTSVNVALLFEKSKIEEKNTASSFAHSNIIEFNKLVRGFITGTSPSDYYSFELIKKATVTIDYSFENAASTDEDMGYCTLYDKNELFLKEGIYIKSDKGSQKMTYLLEPGTYFIKLQGLYGNTTLSVTPMYYDINLSPASDNEWTHDPIVVNIDTSIDYSDIVVLFKDVKETLINNADVWSKANAASVALDGEAFTAKKSGIYSIRITDKYGNNTMQKIEILNIDVTKPKITGAKNNGSYRKPVTLTWSDLQSGINNSKTTLNGKVVTSGIQITKEGKYTLKVYDMVGYYQSIIFYVDFTAPTAGVENGKTYTDSVVLKFKDNVSGIKKITVDDVEESTVYTTLYCYLDGAYTVKLWDKAGNYRKIVFYIKKA